MYTFESRIGYSKVGEDSALTLPAVLDYFQDCSTFQADDLGIGLAFLQERKLAWLVNFWQVVIRKYPREGEYVRVGTSPYRLKGCVGYRNFMLETREGERLAEAASVWSLMDMRRMLPVRIPAEILEKYELAPPFPMEYAPRKIALPEHGAGAAGEIVIRREDLDTNHHVNNAQYVRIAMNQVSGERPVRELQIEYKKQARLGDVMRPLLFDDPASGMTVVALRSTDGRDYAVAKMAFMEEAKKNR